MVYPANNIFDAFGCTAPKSSGINRRFDDNLRLKSFCTLYAVVPKSIEFASNLRRIQYDSELKRPKGSKKRRIYRFVIKASKSVEKASINSQKRPKPSTNCLLGSFKLLVYHNYNMYGNICVWLGYNRC